MLKLSNINFSYDDNEVIRNLSLDIKTGSWLGLIGPNGAGKTTLINILSGLIKPASGSVLLNNEPFQKYSRKEIAKQIAVVPQTAQTIFPFTSLEVVLMGRYPHIEYFGFERAEDIKIAEESMRKTDTWRFRERPVDELSGGERQRVFVARALAAKPKILLLDEPTAFLDIKHQLDIMEILAEMNKNEKITIVSAIHEINLAISYCGEIALLSDKGVMCRGAPTDVITYANLKNAFDSDVYVGINEFTGKPYYVPMKKK